MESNSGSQEPRGELPQSLAEVKAKIRDYLEQRAEINASPASVELTPEEHDAIADGEPYCFRCGRPASSFPEYDAYLSEGSRAVTTRAEAVRREEGTYNPYSNHFACDGCYIAIGQPSGVGGWKAP